MLFGTSVANTVGGNRGHAVKHGQQTLDKNGSMSNGQTSAHYNIYIITYIL